MPPLWSEVTASSVSEYTALFEATGAFASAQSHWFRGEGVLRETNALLPSLARPSANPPDEWSTYQKFRQAGAAFLPHANLTDWDWMLYMRHYGAPTRLLDWSESPLVALYFAVQKPERDAQGGVVWVLDPLRLNFLAGFDSRVYCAAIDDELDIYVPKQVKNAPADAGFKPVALIAARSFPRLVAQQGVFTIIHREPTALDAIADDKLLARICIPGSAKSSIRTTLNRLGINRLSLYPELQSVGEGGGGS